MEVNPIVGFGLGITKFLIGTGSRFKWLTSFVVFLPFTVLLLFNTLNVIEEKNDVSSFTELVLHFLLYFQVSLFIKYCLFFFYYQN